MMVRHARASLVVLWLVTAFSSLLGMHGRSELLLKQTGLPLSWYGPLIGGGALLDALVGLALWRWHRPAIYWVAGANLVVMTAFATALLPSLWLDPLGALLKNLPIASLLCVLYQDAHR